jgi:hypothetical protein
MDENGRIVNHDPYSNNVLNPFKLNWYFLHHNYHHNYCEETFIVINLGQFIFSILDYYLKKLFPLSSTKNFLLPVVVLGVGSCRVQGPIRCWVTKIATV